MKKKPLNRPRLTRPADGFLPIALLAATLLARNWEMPLFLYLYMLAIRLLALASANGLRAAFAIQPSYRQVRGSVKTALLLHLMGGALLAVATVVASRVRGFRMERGSILLGAGLLLNIEHVFYEYLYASGDGRSALVCRGITAGLTLAGLLLSDSASGADPWRSTWLLAATGAAALAALVIGCAVGGGLKGRLNAGVVRCAPRALLQTALYPGLALAAWMIEPLASRLDARPEVAGAAFFAGLTVYELCRTPFRRSRLEARPLHRGLLIVCGVAAAMALPWIVNPRLLHGVVAGLKETAAWRAADLMEDAPVFSAALALAAACAFALYGRLPGGGEQ